MKNSKFTYTIVIFFWVLIGVGIFLNPYTDTISLNINSELCLGINLFFQKLGLNYRFNSSDILYSMGFTEYFIFGIITTLVVKFHSKNIWKNIFTPLFFGLGLSVGEIYFKSFSDLKIGLYEVIFSFVCFCIGLIFCIIIVGIKSSAGKSSGFKINKYRKGR